jgi:hypothetical protein
VAVGRPQPLAGHELPQRQPLFQSKTSMTPIYLDYNATTPLDPAVVEAMLPS